MPDPLDALLSAQQRAACRAPLAQARTLPRAAFTSVRFFELETERIFCRHWTAIGFTEQVANAGDLLPIELCGIPLLVVRTQDDRVRVFHNIVPYDGCQAVITPLTGRQHIITPYHGWRYSLDGKLIGTPRWDGSWDETPVALGDRPGDLAEVRSACWGPVIFVDLSGVADDLAAQVEPLERITAQWRIADLAFPAASMAHRCWSRKVSLRTGRRITKTGASTFCMNRLCTRSMRRHRRFPG